VPDNAAAKVRHSASARARAGSLRQRLQHLSMRSRLLLGILLPVGLLVAADTASRVRSSAVSAVRRAWR